MKIAILSLLNTLVERGVENWATNVKNYFEPEHTIDIFSAASENISLDLGHKESALNLQRRLFLDYWSLKNLKLALVVANKLKDYDIVIPTNGGWQSIIIRLLTWVYGNKVIIFGHSGIGWDDRVNLWTCPNRFVALSNFSMKWATKVNPFINIVHVPIPVNLDKFSPIGPKTKDIKLSHPLALAVAAAVHSKQLDKTIKAVARVPNLSLVLLSSGPDVEYLDQLAHQLLPHRYQRVKVNQSEIPNWYREADVFTLCPWVNESFPVVYLEAMASNLPIVATNDPIRIEAIGDAGLFVNPHNTEEYSSALKNALNINWKNRPLQRAMTYSHRTIYSKYLLLFKEVANYEKFT